MINYILQVILFQVLFLAVYDFFLSKETFFIKNRWYLIATPMLSFLIPLLKIPTFQKVVPQEFIVYLPEIVLSPEKAIQKAIQGTYFYESINYVAVLFWVGVCFFLIVFLIKLVKIIYLIRKHKALKESDFTLVFIPKQNKAFSFFNYIFLGNEIAASNKEKIIEHEMVHSKQRHSLDLLFFEFLKIIMWFNPLIYFYQKRITLVHEYISDAIVSKSESKEDYINNLLSNFFQVENISFINQFYKQSLIKQRIMMMTKKQSKKMNQLKYLVLIPVLASMLFYTSCISKDTENKSEISLLKVQNQQLRDSLSSIKRKLEFTFKSASSDYEKRRKNISSDGSFSFMRIDKAPTFPGCESGDKDCFSKMIQLHFVKNFDNNILKTLALEAGRKRVFIGFKIDADGNIVDIKARAPHIKIKEEVLRVMNKLPKVIPGEQDGEKVAVKYSIPLTIVVE